MPIDAVRWGRIKDIFHAVAELPAAERAAAIVEQCQGDVDLRHEVESLIEADGRATGQLVAPPASPGIPTGKPRRR